MKHKKEKNCTVELFSFPSLPLTTAVSSDLQFGHRVVHCGCPQLINMYFGSSAEEKMSPKID